jgi:hypothetical protein
MEDSINIIIVPCLVMLIIVFCFNLIYKRWLKALYPDLQANSQSGLPGENINSDLKSTIFLLDKKYRSLDNPDFVRFCNLFRILVLAWFIVFGVTFVTLAFISFT